VDRQPVKTLSEFQAAMEKHKEKDPLLLLLVREGVTHFAAIKP